MQAFGRNQSLLESGPGGVVSGESAIPPLGRDSKETTPPGPGSRDLRIPARLRRGAKKLFFRTL